MARVVEADAGRALLGAEQPVVVGGTGGGDDIAEGVVVVGRLDDEGPEPGDGGDGRADGVVDEVLPAQGVQAAVEDAANRVRRSPDTRQR